MARLIDADALPCDICDFQKCPCFNPLCCRDFSMWFKATAYDVDKVVEALENQKTKKNDTIALCDAEVNGIIDLAIEIVKRGGVDD